MGILDGGRPEVEVDLVDPVASAFVVNQRPGSELRDGKKARPGNELVAPPDFVSTRHVGGDRQPGEVVAGEEAFGREIAVGVKIPLVDSFGFREQAYLALGLRPQPLRMLALGLRPGVVPDDRVVELPLAGGRSIQAAPTVARGVETALDLAEHLVYPVVVEPRRVLELGADPRNHRIGFDPCHSSVDRIAQFIPDGGFQGQRQLPIFRAEFQYGGQRFSQIRFRRFHPDRMDVRADQVAVAEIDTGRFHRSGDHPCRFAEKVLIVGAAPRAVREDHGRLSAPAGAPAALGLVGRRRRDIAQVDKIELGDIHSEFHCRGAEQERQLSFAEPLFAFLAFLGGHLCGVFSSLEETLEIHKAAIALHEIVVYFGENFPFLK